MKKIIIVIIFFTFCNNVYSQNSANKPTRQQTESWIIEKLNKYVTKGVYSTSESVDKTLEQAGIGSISTDYKWSSEENNIKFRIVDNNIIVTSDYSRHTTSKYIQDKYYSSTDSYSKTYTIPLDKITNKEFIDQGYLVFRSNYNSFTVNNSEGSENKTSYYGIRIDAFGEENFSVRFNKAMNHLLSFTKKTKSSELF